MADLSKLLSHRSISGYGIAESLLHHEVDDGMATVELACDALLRMAAQTIDEAEIDRRTFRVPTKGHQMKTEDILGTWCSVGHERIATDGTVTHPFGKDPLPARLVYSPDGSMAVITIRPGLEKLRRSAPVEVRVAALDECIGYMGRFDVVGNTIRHHIEVSINPDLIGVTLERPVISAQGNRVTVRAPGDKNGAVDNITWERLTR